MPTTLIRAIFRAIIVLTVASAALALPPTIASASVNAVSRAAYRSDVGDVSLSLHASPASLDLGGGSATLTTTLSGTKGGPFDSFTVTLPKGASVVPKTSHWGDAWVADPVTSSGKAVFNGPFLVDGSELTFDVALDAESGNRVVSILGNVGSAQVGNAPTPTDGSNPATATVNVDTAPTAEGFSFSTPPGVGARGNLAALVGDADGDPLKVSDLKGPSHGAVTVEGLLLTYTSEVGYEGPDSFTYVVSDGRGGAAAGDVKVTVDPKATPPADPRSQKLDFADPGALVVGDVVALEARAESGLRVMFSSGTPKVCEVVEDRLVALAEGECSVTARQDGDAEWAPAEPVSRAVKVAAGSPVDPEDRSPQSIGYSQPSAGVVGDVVGLDVWATSKLDVTLTNLSPDVCVLKGLTVSLVAKGQCQLTASQPGDDTWAPADDVTISFGVEPTKGPVDPSPQSIDHSQPSAGVVGDVLDVDVRASSGLGVSLTSLTPEVCTVEGLTVTLVAKGQCQLTASQPGDDTWAPADDVTISFGVEPAKGPVDPSPQAIDLSVPATLLGLAPYDVDAAASSGLPVELAVTDGGCTLDGVTLTPASSGVCTLAATQPGNDEYEAAEPVSVDIAFVVPADDSAEADGAGSVLVAVLGNDPDGVDLDEVGTPDHGMAVIEGSRVRYTPGANFRGTDVFSYTVTRGGRSAEATVTVAVGNQAPLLQGARVAQLAGTSASVVLTPEDPNGDAVELSAVSRDRRLSVRVAGDKITVSAAPEASGDATVVVTATDSGGASTRAVVRTRITPLAPVGVTRTLSQDGTTVRWTRPATVGATFEVLLDGEVVCRTARSSCTITQVAGPQLPMSVRTVGRDDTRSVRTAALLSGHGQVLVTTVYFASGSDRLTAKDRRILSAAIRDIHAFGFLNAHVDGYTDSDGGWTFNLALSKRRTKAVADFLRESGDVASTEAWHGEMDPAAPNRTRGGKAMNRRVEVLVTY